ncbi:MAG: hypothetical protein M1840_003032 [Geoglossum simile]|nr:MAG: hypothetical protein M1840_003032 [Geoglossum simile]
MTSKVISSTYIGYVATTYDALVLFEVCLQGRLDHVPRRPRRDEKCALIKSGCVFVFVEKTSGMKRWTDGLAWAPHQALDEFSIYRELEALPKEGVKEGGIIKKTLSVKAIGGQKSPGHRALAGAESDDRAKIETLHHRMHRPLMSTSAPNNCIIPPLEGDLRPPALDGTIYPVLLALGDNHNSRNAIVGISSDPSEGAPRLRKPTGLRPDNGSPSYYTTLGDEAISTNPTWFTPKDDELIMDMNRKERTDKKISEMFQKAGKNWNARSITNRRFKLYRKHNVTRRDIKRFTSQDVVLLGELRGEQNLPWKEIAKKFPERTTASLILLHSHDLDSSSKAFRIGMSTCEEYRASLSLREIRRDVSKFTGLVIVVKHYKPWVSPLS